MRQLVLGDETNHIHGRLGMVEHGVEHDQVAVAAHESVAHVRKRPLRGESNLEEVVEIAEVRGAGLFDKLG